MLCLHGLGDRKYIALFVAVRQLQAAVVIGNVCVYQLLLVQYYIHPEAVHPVLCGNVPAEKAAGIAVIILCKLAVLRKSQSFFCTLAVFILSVKYDRCGGLTVCGSVFVIFGFREQYIHKYRSLGSVCIADSYNTVCSYPSKGVHTAENTGNYGEYKCDGCFDVIFHNAAPLICFFLL